MGIFFYFYGGSSSIRYSMLGVSILSLSLGSRLVMMVVVDRVSGGYGGGDGREWRKSVKFVV